MNIDDRDPVELRLASRTEPGESFSLLTDALLPVALTVMLGSLLWFLLDVRSVQSDEPTRLLRLIFFLFMVAVVGIARIGSRDGSLQSSPYAVALCGVMLLFGYLYTHGGGAFGRGYGGARPLLAMLYLDLLIALIWFGGNYLVRQTAIDPDDVDAPDAGFLSSEEWARQGERAAAVRRRPHPGRAVMVLSCGAVAIFGLGHRQLAGQEELQRHAYWCMVTFLGCGLAVLAMSAVAGLEVYVRGRGARLPAGVIALWLALALPLGASFLLAAHLAPKLQPRPDSFLPELPPFLRNLAREGREADWRAPWEGDDTAPADDQPALAADEGGAPQPGAEGREPGGDRDGGEQGTQGQANPAGSGGAADGGESQGAGEGDEPGAEATASEAGAEPTPGGEDGRQPAASESGEPTPPAPPEPGGGLSSLAKVLALLVGVALLALFALTLARRWRGPLAAWLARRREVAASRPVITRDPFVDPFGPRSPFRDRPIQEIVVHIYRALQAYLALLGAPRQPGRTAHEYLLDLPPSTDSWRAQIVALTDLYAAVEYTPESVDESCREELQAIWERLQRAVRETRR